MSVRTVDTRVFQERCTQEGDVKIVQVHGNLLGRKLRIKKGTQVITLSAPGFSVPTPFKFQIFAGIEPRGDHALGERWRGIEYYHSGLNESTSAGRHYLKSHPEISNIPRDDIPLGRYIYNIYAAGKTIFANNDTSRKELTPDGHNLAQKLLNLQKVEAAAEKYKLIAADNSIIRGNASRKATSEAAKAASEIIWTWIANQPEIVALPAPYRSGREALKEKANKWLWEKNGRLPLDMVLTFLAAVYGPDSPQVTEYMSASSFIEADKVGRIYYPKNHVGPADINDQGMVWAEMGGSNEPMDVIKNNKLGILTGLHEEPHPLAVVVGDLERSKFCVPGKRVTIPGGGVGHAPPPTLGDLIKIEGSGTYILVSCRPWSELPYSVLPRPEDWNPWAESFPELASTARGISAGFSVPDFGPGTTRPLYQSGALPVDMPITQPDWRESLLTRAALEPAGSASAASRRGGRYIKKTRKRRKRHKTRRRRRRRRRRTRMKRRKKKKKKLKIKNKFLLNKYNG